MPDNKFLYTNQENKLNVKVQYFWNNYSIASLILQTFGDNNS